MGTQKYYHVLKYLCIAFLMCTVPKLANGEEAQCSEATREKIEQHLESLTPILDDYCETLVEIPWMKWEQEKVSDPFLKSLKEVRTLQMSLKELSGGLPKDFLKRVTDTEQQINRVNRLITEELEPYDEDVRAACQQETRSKERLEAFRSKFMQESTRAVIIRNVAYNELTILETFLENSKNAPFTTNSFQQVVNRETKIAGMWTVLLQIDTFASNFGSVFGDRDAVIPHIGQEWIDSELIPRHQQFMGLLLEKISKMIKEIERRDEIGFPPIYKSSESPMFDKLKSSFDKVILYYPLPEN
jgi:hypothetical protein